MLYPVEEIRWLDAVAKVDWLGKDTLPEPAFVMTVGYLVKETDTYVVLSMSHGSADCVGTPNEFGPVFTIPKGMIRGRLRLAEADD